jgi:hypothetical protein
VLVRSDLSPGLQLAQACHGMAEFARDHPEEHRKWLAESNYIVVLQVANEERLLDHADILTGWCGPHLADFFGIPFTLVHEPDINEHTAIVIAPGKYHTRLANLPLAGKELAMSP